MEQQRVEHQPVLAKRLPAIDRVVGKHENPPLAGSGFDDHRAVTNLIRTAKQAAEDSGIAALESRNHTGSIRG